MKPLVEFIRSTIIAGLLVILPIGLMAVVIIKIVDLLKQVLTPIVELITPDSKTAKRVQSKSVAHCAIQKS